MDIEDRRYMEKVLRLAAKGRTSPNPKVGALLVKDGRIIATGYHHAAGLAHAEIDALAKVNHRAPGATLYVNLEPHCYHGKTPPCTDAIIEAGIREVVAGMEDPNPRVRGRGFKQLRDAGIRVRTGILEERCRRLNAPFIRAVTTGLPFIILKSAATADGHTATKTGASRWITGDQARRYVHRLRARVDAVLVGSGTVLGDDPLLTVRWPPSYRGPMPTRIVLDRRLRSPVNAHVFNTDAPTWLLTTESAPRRRMEAFRAQGVRVIPVACDQDDDFLPSAMRRLARDGLIEILAEPGARLAASLLFSGLVSRYLLFLAPKCFGGRDAPGILGGEGVAEVSEAIPMKWERTRRLGPDLLLEASVEAGGESEGT